MNIMNMTKREFMEIPLSRWDEHIKCTSLVIIPESGRKSELHDSGYRCMSFVACDRDTPIKRISECSDVVHLGGFFDNPPGDWRIDCLPKSGLLRLFHAGNKKILTGDALSSFQVTLWEEENY